MEDKEQLKGKYRNVKLIRDVTFILIFLMLWGSIMLLLLWSIIYNIPQLTPAYKSLPQISVIYKTYSGLLFIQIILLFCSFVAFIWFETMKTTLKEHIGIEDEQSC